MVSMFCNSVVYIIFYAVCELAPCPKSIKDINFPINYVKIYSFKCMCWGERKYV